MALQARKHVPFLDLEFKNAELCYSTMPDVIIIVSLLITFSYTIENTNTYEFYSYPNVNVGCNLILVMHFTMPRNSYHYNDIAVKLPGYIVAMAIVCAAESLIVVLGYRYFLA